MPLFYYVSDHEKDAMQKPLDAERLLRMLGASGKLAGFRQAAYMIERVRDNPEYVQLITKRLYRELRRSLTHRVAAWNAICEHWFKPAGSIRTTAFLTSSQVLR